MTLASILFPDYRRKVLGLLLRHPAERYHLREIARLTDMAAVGALSRELAKLTEAGILHSQRIGNQVQYVANQACPVYDELASIMHKINDLSDKETLRTTGGKNDTGKSSRTGAGDGRAGR